MDHASHRHIPTDSLILGYAPMVPFFVAAIGAWMLPPPWPDIAIWLGTIWGGLVLSFVGGVRRGYGFGSARASTTAEIATMLVYFTIAGIALFLPWPQPALLLLAVGYAIAAVLDDRAAHDGNAPAHFARLRVPQFSIAVISLLILALRA